MKLRLRILAGMPGASGPVPMLCDEAGVALPNQRAVKVDARVKAPTVVTAEFVVDGVDVVLDGVPKPAT